MIFGLGKGLISRLIEKSSCGEPDLCAKAQNKPAFKSNAGNIFFALFAAVGMVGAVGYGFNSVIKGPVSGMTEVTRRTVAESTVVTSSRLAIVGATTQQSASGDCDGDNYVEPLPYRDAGTGAKPTGGGWLPTGLLPNSIDPWNSEYGYCAWDPGPISVVDADSGCGGATPRRLQGAPDNKRTTIAIISAGKDKKFQTSCVAYNGGAPTAPLVVRTPGSDDIVLGYTYAEANDLGGGLWTPSKDPLKTGNTTTAGDKNLDVAGGGVFTDKVVLTTGGLVLPDETSTGACDSSANDKQIRRNMSTSPPSLEICDFTGGSGWIGISGLASADDARGPAAIGQLVGHWQLNESSGTVAADRMKRSDGALINNPTWAPAGGKLGGAASFNRADNEKIRIPRNGAFEPSSVTVSAWAKANGTPSDDLIVVKEWNNHAAPTQMSYGIAYNSSANPAFFVGTSSTLLGAAITPAIPAANRWVHIVGTYDPSAPSQQIKLYVDGVLANTATQTGALAYDKSNKGDLYIGGGYNASQSFHGEIDDVRIYNYPLSAEQVAALYDLGTPALNLDTPKTAGKLSSWGSGTNGQLGTGTTTNRHSPVAVIDRDDFTQVSAGRLFTCGVKTGGSVWCWGSDSDGQLGNGAVTGDQTSPGAVANISNIVKVSSGYTHACALEKTGAAWCWGLGTNGELGQGANTSSLVPVKVSAYSDFTDISAGTLYTCGVRYGGQAVCWGANANGQLGDGTTTNSNKPVIVSTVTNFVSIATDRLSSGGVGTCGVTKQGKIYCWGKDNGGDFGTGSAGATHAAPTEVTATNPDFVKIDRYESTSCALRADGTLWCWGLNTYGLLGDGTTTSSSVPVKVSGLADVVDFTVSNYNVCAVRKSGELWCWGDDTGFQLGDGTGASPVQLVPKKIGEGYLNISTSHSYSMVGITNSSAQTVTLPDVGRGKIAGAYYFTCTIDNSQAVWCWGRDTDGQLGNGSVITADQTSPSLVDNGGSALGWTMVTAGAETTAANGHACGIKNDGSAWCWGSDSDGQLGNGATPASASPSPVSESGPWSVIQAASKFTCGIKADGTLWCWGDDASGQLGNGAAAASVVPVQIGAGSTWKHLGAADHRSACAIKTDGTLWCWGSDTAGQLGNGSVITANQPSPVQVGTDTDWSSVAAGAHACAIKTDGTLWCWGQNNRGQIGDGTTGNTRHEPVLVADPGPWKQVNVNSWGGTTCGIKLDGTGWCWGAEQLDGRQGNGPTITTDQLVPYPVDGGGTWKAFSTTAGGHCGIKTDDSVWCWGTDNSGALGNGDVQTAAMHSPYPVDTSVMKPTFINGLAQANMQMGSTFSLTPLATGSTASFGFPSASNARIQKTSGDNHLIIEAAEAGFAAQMGVSNSTNSYGFGYSAATGSFGFIAGSGLVSNGVAALGVGNDGNVGVSTGGNPASKLDIAGGLRVTSDTCTAAKAGTVFYASGKFQFCNTGGTATLMERVDTTPPPPAPWDLAKPGMRYNGACLPKANGKLYCWGSNAYGSAAVGEAVTAGFNTPKASIDTALWKRLGNGYSHICGIKADNTLWCWGHGATGQRGDNTTTANQGTPTAVSGGGTWIDVAAGTGHTCGIKSNGTAWCWGTNTDGQLGNGTTTQSNVPDEVNGSGIWTAIMGGQYHSCGLKGDGTIWCWGSDTQGQLGNGATTTTTQTSPVQVTSAVPWVKLATGAYAIHSCGIKSDGTAWCWGQSSSGGLGNGSASQQNAPVQFGGANTWIDIAIAQGATCAIRTDGSLWCSGYGTYGQLGNGTNSASQLTPVQISQAGPWVSVGGSAFGFCAVKGDATVWCWGRGQNGALGNGNTADSNIPVKISEPTP